MKKLTIFTEEGFLNVIIETPKGSRNKFVYDPESELFKLSKVLPVGTNFPFHFGFIPQTLAGDGDPMDALMLMETDCFPGCVVECRIIGIIKAEQKEKEKKKQRNDRVIAVAKESIEYHELKQVRDWSEQLRKELVAFFEYYTGLRDKKFIYLGTGGPKEARQLILKNKK